MKRILIPAFALLVIVAEALGQETKVAQRSAESSASWKRYTVRFEKFSVELPTHPAMNTDIQIVGYERDERREVVLGAYAEGVVYTVYTLENRYPEKNFNAFCKEVFLRPVWNPASEKKFELNKIKGRQYYSNHPLGGVVQMFSGNGRLYRFQAFGAPPEDPRVKQFFSSIELRENDEAIPVVEGKGVTFKPIGQTESPSDQQVFRGTQVDRKALVIMKPEPSYTLEARQFQTVGSVVLKVVFAGDGSITNIQVVEDLPRGLTKQAIQSAEKIKFIPAVKDGKYVSMWYQLVYNFNLY